MVLDACWSFVKLEEKEEKRIRTSRRNTHADNNRREVAAAAANHHSWAEEGPTWSFGLEKLMPV